MASPQKETGYTAISNELLETLAKIRIAGEARQMLDIIIRKTYGYNKKQDRISTSQFMELTNLPHYSIWKARKKLVTMNLITITKKGDSQILIYSIQKDYSKWVLSPKRVTVTKKGELLSPKKQSTITNMATHKRQYTKDNLKKGICDSSILNSYKDKDNIQYINNSIAFIDALKQNPAYSHIDIDNELHRMDAWLLVNPKRKKTKRFVVNWLSRIEKPLPTTPKKVIKYDPPKDEPTEKPYSFVPPAGDVAKLIKDLAQKRR